MRLIWIALGLVLIGLVGYAYYKDPDGCWKIVHDFGDLFATISPVTIEIKGATPSGSNNSTNAAPADTDAAPAASSDSGALDLNAPGRIASLVDGKLISPGGDAYIFPAGAPLSSIRYFAIYYSAAWVPACQTFTPQLVQWYNGFKPSHPDFELIFVSEDHDEISQRGFMRQMNMPWPAVRFGFLQHDGNGTFKGSGIEQFAGPAVIPDLVLVDPSGKVLLDSYQGSVYVGPESVMNGIAALVGK